MRAADYDDWVTDTQPETGRPTHGLNGDIRFGTNVTRRRHELSSMGIRVDRVSLWRRLEVTGQLEFDASVAEGAPGRGQRQRLAKKSSKRCARREIFTYWSKAAGIVREFLC